MSLLIIFAALFAFTYVYVYLKAVVQVRRKHGQRAYPQLESRSPASLPPDVWQKFTREVPGLEALGFTVVDYLHHAGLPQHESGRADIYIALLKNEASGDLAVLSEFFVQIEHVSSNVGLVTFATELTGGTSISTSNSSTVPVFKPDARRPSFRFPGVDDARFLYRVHRALLDRHAPGQRGTLPSAGMEIPHLCDTEARSLRRQVECGYFYMDEAHGMCLITWKGALVMTGRQMYGVRDLLSAAMRMRARSTLSSLGLRAA